MTRVGASAVARVVVRERTAMRLAPAHGRQQRQLATLVQRRIGTHETTVHRMGQMRAQLGEGRIHTLQREQRGLDAAAVGQFEMGVGTAHALTGLGEQTDDDAQGLESPGSGAYAAASMDTNQDDPTPKLTVIEGGRPEARFTSEAMAATAERLRATNALGGRVRRGLIGWTSVITVGSVAGIALGRLELVMFLVLAGLFVLAQSWDLRDRALTGDPEADRAIAPARAGTVLRVLVPLVMPLLGVAVYGGIAAFARMSPADAAHVAALQWSIAAAFLCLLAALPPIQQQLARTFMSGPFPGHTARLTATMALVVLLLPVPAALLMSDLVGLTQRSPAPLIEVPGLVGQLVGMVTFSFAAVGLGMGRGWRETCARLGLEGMRPHHPILAAVGLAAVTGVNFGMEWIERTRFHDLWLRDQDMVRLMTAHLGLAATIVLGLCAGLGEEILVRGALQPRTGLFWASLLFAAGHVQYTWFGMLTILALGITLGLIRRASNTTTVIVVHMLYDIVAALGAK